MALSRCIARPASILSLFVLLAGVPASSAAQEGFGLGEQVLHIGAASLIPKVSSTSGFSFHTDGYLYSDVAGREYLVPVSLPEGVEVTQICLYAYDLSANQILLFFEAARLAPGGQPAGVVELAPALQTTFDIGYGVVCTPPLSYLYRDTQDVTGDGSPEHLAHRLRFFVGSTNAGVGGVRISWRRQVSPPPGAATFADVPTSHLFFPFVEALAASGITAGCGGGNYCPGEPITRGEMAVFLSAALGLHWPN